MAIAPSGSSCRANFPCRVGHRHRRPGSRRRGPRSAPRPCATRAPAIGSPCASTTSPSTTPSAASSIGAIANGRRPAGVRHGRRQRGGREPGRLHAQARAPGGSSGSTNAPRASVRVAPRAQVRVERHRGVRDRVAPPRRHDLAGRALGRRELDAERVLRAVRRRRLRGARDGARTSTRSGSPRARATRVSPWASVNDVARRYASAASELAVTCAASIGKPCASTTATGSASRASGSVTVTSLRPPSGTASARRASGDSASTVATVEHHRRRERREGERPVASPSASSARRPAPRRAIERRAPRDRPRRARRRRAPRARRPACITTSTCASPAGRERHQRRSRLDVLRVVPHERAHAPWRRRRAAERPVRARHPRLGGSSASRRDPCSGAAPPRRRPGPCGIGGTGPRHDAELPGRAASGAGPASIASKCASRKPVRRGSSEIGLPARVGADHLDCVAPSTGQPRVSTTRPVSTPARTSDDAHLRRRTGSRRRSRPRATKPSARARERRGARSDGPEARAPVALRRRLEREGREPPFGERDARAAIGAASSASPSMTRTATNAPARERERQLLLFAALEHHAELDRRDVAAASRGARRCPALRLPMRTSPAASVSAMRAGQSVAPAMATAAPAAAVPSSADDVHGDCAELAKHDRERLAFRARRASPLRSPGARAVTSHGPSPRRPTSARPSAPARAPTGAAPAPTTSIVGASRPPPPRGRPSRRRRGCARGRARASRSAGHRGQRGHRGHRGHRGQRGRRERCATWRAPVRARPRRSRLRRAAASRGARPRSRPCRPPPRGTRARRGPRSKDLHVGAGDGRLVGRGADRDVHRCGGGTTAGGNDSRGGGPRRRRPGRRRRTAPGRARNAARAEDDETRQAHPGERSHPASQASGAAASRHRRGVVSRGHGESVALVGCRYPSPARVLRFGWGAAPSKLSWRVRARRRGRGLRRCPAGCGAPDCPPEDGLFAVGGSQDASSNTFQSTAPTELSCNLGPDGGVCACADQPLLGDPPNLYFVLDRSGSMSAATSGSRSSTRIGDLVVQLGPRADYGATVFPRQPR